MPFCHLRLRAEKPRDSRYPKVLHSLGDHLRKRRLDLRLSQRQLAARIGADEAAVNNWEKGNTSPSLRFIAPIFAFVGYDPSPKATGGSVGSRVAARRRILGVSRRRLAAELGIDESTIARWERGKGGVRPSRRVRGLFERWLARRLDPTHSPSK